VGQAPKGAGVFFEGRGRNNADWLISEKDYCPDCAKESTHKGGFAAEGHRRVDPVSSFFGKQRTKNSEEVITSRIGIDMGPGKTKEERRRPGREPTHNKGVSEEDWGGGGKYSALKKQGIKRGGDGKRQRGMS